MANKLSFIWGATLALLLLQAATPIIAECNVCSTGQVACVSDQQYAFCANGIPNLQSIYSCQNGSVCSTFGLPICQKEDDNTIKDCESCNICDVTNTFACTSDNTFALCLGTREPSEKYTGSCAPDAVCSVNFSYICGAADQVVATCPKREPPPTTPSTTTTTSTTPEPVTPSITDPSEYCDYIQEEGRFPMGSNPATTCHQFVSCIERNGIWRGAVYVCPSNSYFDSSSKTCVAEAPPRCGPRVRSISLLDIELD